MKTVFRSIRLKQDNRGSAIILVVIAMVFVVALGAAILYVSYTGYKIALAERADKENFYKCSAVMDDIRAGLEDSVTTSIATAYTNAVKTYAKGGSGFDPQSAFAEAFVEQLAVTTVKVNGVSCRLFNSDTSSGKTAITSYNTAYLAGYVSLTEDETLIRGVVDYTVSQGTVTEAYDSEGVLTSLTLKSVSVKYTHNGYESNVSSDITINIPDFFAKSLLSESLNNCAVIAEDGLSQSTGGSVGIKGDIYAGGLTVTGNGNSLSLSGGNVICNGGVSVLNSAKLSFNAPEYELWADEITAGSSASTGSVNLNGKVYVEDDLVLTGDGGSSATLKGTYFGFGNDGSNPDKSSAILINGRHSALNISSLDKLTLAGVSFINIADENLTTNGSTVDDDPVPMGESLAVKSDQLAYLVPPECISNYASNPCLFSGDVEAPDCDTSTVLWGTSTLGDYIGSGKGSIKTLYKTLDSDGNKIAYVLLVFNSQKYANTYFEDYFAEYPNQIAEYLGLYAQISDKSSDAYFDTAGTTYYTDNYGTTSAQLTLVPASNTVWTDGVQARYASISSPLSEFVNLEAMAQLPKDTKLNFVKNGKVVAIVTNKSDFSYSEYSDSLQLIISTGNVSVGADYKGMIMADGVVNVGANITAAGISSIASATCGGYTLYDFLTDGGLYSSGSSYSSDSWAPGKLVVFENWTKG